jgi:TRAP-type C4-dicarboxylate transport system permease small subunit
MTAKQRYAQAMDWLYLACIGVSGLALVAITLMIPSGVFMRYVMNNPLSWPEPASVVLMVMFSFIGGAAAYRANVHVAVQALVNAVSPKVRRWMGMAVNVFVATVGLFMLYYGIQLCIVTQHSTMAEFPDLSQAVVYSPIPIAGFFTLLFLIERVWVGEPPKTSIMYADQATEAS